MKEPNRLLSVEEAADRLNCSRAQAYELVRRGRLRSVKLGRLRRVPVAAIDELIATLELEAAEAC
jgi:excisionase family DNA binding protein